MLRDGNMTTVTTQEMRTPDMTVPEFKAAINNRDKKAIDFIQELRSNDPKRVEFAQQQGRDKVAHFISYIEGSEDDTQFSAYFMKDNSHHIFQHEGFWQEISNTFVDMHTIQGEDPDVKQHVFPGMGVYLQEETQRLDDTGEIFAVRYVAHQLESAREMGSLAAAYAAQ